MNVQKGWVITDEFLAKLQNQKATIRIYGKVYVIDANQEDLIVGDVVLDRKDGCHGVIDFITPSTLNSKNIILQAAVRSDGCTELGVPLARLVRLKKVAVEAN